MVKHWSNIGKTLVKQVKQRTQIIDHFTGLNDGLVIVGLVIVGLVLLMPITGLFQFQQICQVPLKSKLFFMQGLLHSYCYFIFILFFYFFFTSKLFFMQWFLHTNENVNSF